MFLKRTFFWPSAMISKDCTIGTPEAIMVAIWRLKMATSRGLTALPVAPNNGLDFSRTVCGFIPWRRSSAFTSEAFFAGISPFMRLPRLSSATQSYMVILLTSARWAPRSRAFLAIALAVAMPDSPGGSIRDRRSRGRSSVQLMPDMAGYFVVFRATWCFARGCGGNAATSILGDAIDLGQAGDSRLDLQQRRGAQVVDADLARDLPDLQRIAPLQHDLLDFLGHRHDLVDAHAAFVALVAMLAADCLVEGQPGIDVFLAEAGREQHVRRQGLRLLAVVQAAGQALGDHQSHRRGDGVGRDAHVHQARDGLRRVVGVQRGEHHVAGLRSLDADLGRFQVADLADHDHVRVLAQERAQGGGEGHAALDVLLDLVDALDADFDRVFHGRDVALGGVENIERGVQ